MTVLLTDRAWHDTDVERAVIEAAGFSLVAGPAQAQAAHDITRLAAQHCPDAIMTCWADVNAETIHACPELKIIARLGVGLDNIDRAAAAERGIVVTNVPDYCVEEVSDHALSMLLAWARGLVGFDREVKAGRWDPLGGKLRRVRDMIVGIAGFGRIGRRTAEKLVPFGVKLLVFDKLPTGDLPFAVEQVDLDSLVARSDAVIIHLPLTPETRHLFGIDVLRRMRLGSLLVNVSRGGLVDNDALIAALDDGPVGAAALDVIDGEPNPPRALTGNGRVIATPHIAFASVASLAELRRRAAEEVVRVLTGRPPHHPCSVP